MPIPSLGERRPAPDEVGLGDWLLEDAADDADDAEDAAEDAEEAAEDAEDSAEDAEEAADTADETADEADDAAEAADDAAEDAEDAPETPDELPDAGTLTGMLEEADGPPEEGTVVTETEMDPGTVTVGEERGALPLTVVVMLTLALGALATDEGTEGVEVSLATGEEKEPDIPVKLK